VVSALPRKLPIQRRLIALSRPVRYAVSRWSFRLLGNTQELIALRNSQLDRPMLVVGNGPSLNLTPLDEFMHIPSIGMNKIDLIFNRTKWRPSLIMCINSIVASQHQNALASSAVPVFLAWKSRSFVKRRNRATLNYFNVNSSSEFSFDAVDGFGTGATVTYTALQMAFWMGANPVILLGIDHNFSYKGPSLSYEKIEGPDGNHFDPNYFSAGTYWGTPDLAECERGYRLARSAYKDAGRAIYDATVGGKLRIFDKISLADAMYLVR